jgi:hypothetical protein
MNELCASVKGVVFGVFGTFKCDENIKKQYFMPCYNYNPCFLFIWKQNSLSPNKLHALLSLSWLTKLTRCNIKPSKHRSKELLLG